MLPRRLELAFLLYGVPFAWRCTFCKRLFSAPGLEVSHDDQGQISRDFRQHVCRIRYEVLRIEDLVEFDQRASPPRLMCKGAAVMTSLTSRDEFRKILKHMVFCLKENLEYPTLGPLTPEEMHFWLREITLEDIRVVASEIDNEHCREPSR